jgi:hypothetical protein
VRGGWLSQAKLGSDTTLKYQRCVTHCNHISQVGPPSGPSLVPFLFTLAAHPLCPPSSLFNFPPYSATLYAGVRATMENVGLNPHKCKHCQKLVFDLRKTREVYPSLNQSALFDVTPEELAGGAEEDCALMKWILNYINAPKHSSQPSYDGLVMKWDLSEPLPQRRNTDLVTAMGRLLGDIFGIRAFVRDLVLKMDIEDTESDISCIRDFNIWNKRTRKTGGIPNRSLFGVCTSPGECIDYQVWSI